MRNRFSTLSAGAIVVALLSAACSVSTPRDQELSAGAGGGVTASADFVTGDGLAAPVDGSGEVAGAADPARGASLATPTGGSTGSGGSSGGSGPAGTKAATPTGSAAGAGQPAAGAPPASVAPASTAPVTGVTKDSITVSIIAGFSGPLGPVIAQAYGGMQTWLEDVNDAGGINGRKVIFKKVDHKETADGGVAACKEALSNGSFFAAVPEGTEANLTAVSCLDAAGVPTLYYSGTTDPKWKIAFADIATSARGGTVAGGFVANALSGKGKKIGVMHNKELAYKAMVDTFVPEARKLGLDVVKVEAVEPNQASFTSQLLRMKEAGVQILVISATAEAVGILRDAKTMGYNPQFTGWGFQFDFITTGARNLFEGVTGMRTYATVDSAAYEKYAARMKARGRGRDRGADLEGFPSYGHAMVIGEMLKRAGPNPTRESLVAGAETIKGFDTGILPPITWGPGKHEGADGIFPTVCCSSDWTWKGQGPARDRF